MTEKIKCLKVEIKKRKILVYFRQKILDSKVRINCNF